MRIRKAAIAGATAVAVAFSGTSIATAETTVDQGDNQIVKENHTNLTTDGAEQDTTDKDYTPSLSSQINTGLNLEGDKAADGVSIFGSSKDFTNVPNWAKALYGLLIAGGIGSVLGMIVGPLDNFIKYGPFSR
ncbi:hypothetical protein [Corynebacterium sp. HMSC04H06]|uniref:hypothetical protein n=1 Tax=Corynebacterium sp. HMSC04H06 TaxID=1581050 RepID=UPI0008A1D1DD|nr:hypothetical protein [Corynebacterium sp. HMSC04H06]OFS19831.1 hypothetical protein HMPREF3067_09350 [Corynebacterium sp. HMSC04H06]